MGWFYGTPLWQWIAAGGATLLGLISWAIPDGTQCDAIYFSIDLETQEIMEVICWIMR